MDDDIIWVEEITEQRKEGQSLVHIYKDPAGGISFQSAVDPASTARILTGLAHHILENHIG